MISKGSTLERSQMVFGSDDNPAFVSSTSIFLAATSGVLMVVAKDSSLVNVLPGV